MRDSGAFVSAISRSGSSFVVAKRPRPANASSWRVSCVIRFAAASIRRSASRVVSLKRRVLAHRARLGEHADELVVEVVRDAAGDQAEALEPLLRIDVGARARRIVRAFVARDVDREPDDDRAASIAHPRDVLDRARTIGRIEHELVAVRAAIARASRRADSIAVSSCGASPQTL